MKDHNFSTIYLVRHGETEFNVSEIIQGQTDSPLTLKGQQQAKTLSEEFKGINLDAVFSSDLLRAKRTAEIISINRQLAINTTALLRERAFGSFEGKTQLEFRETNKHLLEKLQTLKEEERKKFKFEPEYESDEEVATRFMTFLREVAATFIGKTVLVVSHGAAMRIMLTHFGFGTMEEFPPGSISNTAYVKLESDGLEFFIKETKGINKVKVL